MKLDEIEDRIISRTIFRNALSATEDGRTVLMWLGNECGAWAQDPAVVKPELIALWNRLLGCLGIVRADNLGEITERIALAANDEDIALERSTHARREASRDAPGDTAGDPTSF